MLPISLQNACHCQFYELEKLDLLHNVLCVFLLNPLKYNPELFLFTLKIITELSPQMPTSQWKYYWSQYPFKVLFYFMHYL